VEHGGAAAAAAAVPALAFLLPFPLPSLPSFLASFFLIQSATLACHFRPREKVNRPLTRRRRENSVDCLEKLRTLHENVLHAMELTELMVIRERKKRDIYVGGSKAEGAMGCVRVNKAKMRTSVQLDAGAEGCGGLCFVCPVIAAEVHASR